MTNTAPFSTVRVTPSWRVCINTLLAIFAALCSVTAPAQLVPPDTEDGKTGIIYPEEPFRNFSQSENGIAFVKFSIILSEPTKVYFQNSENFLFHYDFAKEHLQPFLGMSRPQFDAVSLRAQGQQVVLGAVLFAPYGGPREVGIQFVGLDAYPKEQVAQWFTAVRSAITTAEGETAPAAIYMPSFEQSAAAKADREWFQTQGIEVGGVERWISGDQAYSAGWALGRLVYVPGGEIDAAYAAGQLTYGDILLTDGVPAEVPFLAGIISLNAATPNSHVAILAKNQGVPFAYVAGAAKQALLQSLVGKDTLLRVRDFGFGSEVLINGVDENLDPQLRAKILSYKAAPRAKITPPAKLGRLSSDVTTLTARDLKYFGGKASNFGLLRRTIPDNSPHAIAFSFDLWKQYLGNINPDTGLTLREEIDARLGSFSWPPNIAEARLRLDEVRKLIRKKVKFTDAQKDAIVAELIAAGFDPNRQLRFRSSTNLEDTGVLTGAGLYESFNGCLADSLDGDSDGPSHCCSDTEPEEQTIISAFEKVYASLYNENAWLERLRHRVPEDQAGMAVLVHHNFLDEDELANGVVTLKRKRYNVRGGGGGVISTLAKEQRVSYEANIATQFGSTSVTNPSGGAKVEVVIGALDGGDPYFYTQQYSSLVQLGAHAMTWEADYHELFGLLRQVADAYAAMFPAKREFTLDFEFKRMRTAPDQAKIIVKQVREVVTPEPRTAAPFLLNAPAEYVVFQGEHGDAFAYHRMKSALHLETRNLRLSPGSLAQGLYQKSSIDFLSANGLQQLTNGPRGWPGYRFSFTGGAAQDRWAVGSSKTRTDYKLRTALTVRANVAEELVFTQRDFDHTLTAIYKAPVPYIDFEGTKQRRSDSVSIVPRDSLVPQDEPQVRRMNHPSGVNVETSFYWPKYEGGGVIVKTYPLAAWVETRITGLTTEPIVLKSEFSQTYGPGHHNFSESFIFEPQLDPDVSAQQRAELQEKNIRLLHIRHDTFGEGDFWNVLGLDGKFRTEP
ncbi:PEP/pyruvate-binding domain-containing protein [Verrucomicrobiota bacterium sgz303538]